MNGPRPLPNYMTGKRGKQWAKSLRAALNAGYEIVVEETGVRVYYDYQQAGTGHRPWFDRRGNRYDSRDCKPKL